MTESTTLETQKTDCQYPKGIRNYCILPNLVITVFQYLLYIGLLIQGQYQ